MRHSASMSLKLITHSFIFNHTPKNNLQWNLEQNTQLFIQELFSVLLLAIFNLFWYVGKCTVSVFLNKHSLSGIWYMSGLNLLWRHWLDEFLATDWCWHLCTGSNITTINFICWKFGSKFHFKEEHSSNLNYQWYFPEFLCSSKIRSLYSMSEWKK